MHFSFKRLLTIIITLSLLSCSGQIKSDNSIVKNESPSFIFKTGADNFSVYIPLLKEKKVGILTNQTGIISYDSLYKIPELNNKFEVTTGKTKTIHLVDFLIENEVNVQKIYAPEHGFRGTADAGELIKDGKDTKTGLPIISLYGNNKKPSPEQLSGIDVMLFDLQDVGARFYTYISSLHYLM